MLSVVYKAVSTYVHICVASDYCSGNKAMFCLSSDYPLAQSEGSLFKMAASIKQLMAWAMSALLSVRLSIKLLSALNVSVPIRLLKLDRPSSMNLKA